MCTVVIVARDPSPLLAVTILLLTPEETEYRPTSGTAPARWLFRRRSWPFRPTGSPPPSAAPPDRERQDCFRRIALHSTAYHRIFGACCMSSGMTAWASGPPRAGRAVLLPLPCPFLAPMQRRDKQDIVTALDFVRLLALQLPVGIVDQHQDARAAAFNVSCSGVRSAGV